MKQIIFLSLCVISLLASCDDNTDTLGGSLTNTEDLISVSDGVFKVTSRSIVADSVLSRSITGYLGNVKDPETGTYIKSDFMTQFHSLENNQFPPASMLAYGVKADSCDVRLFLSSYYGDSLTSMKATIYEMASPIEENRDYYSSFDPVKNGLVRIGEGAIKSTKVFSMVDMNMSDSARYSGNYTNNILFNLNEPYTDRNGKTYNNYGTYIMQRYYDNAANFKNTYNFLHNVCPGFYIKFENGAGAMAYINSTQMNVYYTTEDTIKHANYNSFAGTEEVRQLTQVHNDKQRLQQLAEDNTCTYIKSPSGIFTELTLPVEDIYAGHEKDSINSAKITIKRLNNLIDNKYAFPAPMSILMVQKDKAGDFFKKKEIANYRTSFVATFSNTENGYTFGNIGQLIKHMHDLLPADPIMREQWKKANPNWNKVLLIPVDAQYTTYNAASLLTSISHNMSLTSVRLVGGTENPNGDIEVSVIYSKFHE